MVRALLCHNSSAGTEGKDKDSILAALKLAGYDASYVSVKDDDFKKTLAKSVDLIVAAGGDGTLATVLTSLQDRKTPVAILPLGTANNFARSLGIAGTPQELVETWTLDRYVDVNIGSVTGYWGTTLFLESYGVGVFPAFLEDVAKRKKPKGAGNLLKGREAFQDTLKDAKPFDVLVKMDGKTYEKTLLGVEVANIAFTGPGLPIAAKADLGDGKLDVVFFETADRKKLIKWIDSPQVEMPPVTLRKATEVSLTWTDQPARVDDQYFSAIDKEQTVEIVCEEKPVHILMPVKHPVQKAHEKKAASA
ncbi:MAG: diacylglycerol kinase family protein [Pseudolabrys sp.]|nr:diacylglycerol kinase family protein [Pseudolabrys sp.]MDP2298540.1 diacylglycerol kinase family protein [Pseudolabrys sp.]